MNGANSVAFLLAHAGFDVWLGNNRGSIYSRKHATLDPNKDAAKFWDFSFYELGVNDAPAMVDFVTKKTGKAKISWIGHSQGTSQMFSALSENIDGLQSKLNAFLAFAPIVNLSHSQTETSRELSGKWPYMEATAELIHMYELNNPTTQTVMNTFCTYFPSVCKALSKNFSYDSPYCDPDSEAVISYRTDSSASLYQLIHYGQMTQTGVFKKFDYGSAAKNTQHYGTAVPPTLDISKNT